MPPSRFIRLAEEEDTRLREIERPRITEEARKYMEGRLSKDRTWRNTTQLAEALEESFGLTVTPEAVRQHLLSMGYRWKRTRCAPSAEPDPEEEGEARTELEELKRGP